MRFLASRFVAPVIALAAFWGCSTDVEFANSGSGGTAQNGTTSTTGNGGNAGATTGTAGTSAGGTEPGCQWSPDANPCGDGFYCNAPDCQSGTCEAVSGVNDGVKDPVCGCDGVNYWNATTASNYSMPVASQGECAQPVACTVMPDTKCPSERHFCGHLVDSFNACFDPSTTMGGVCWGMPKQCPPVVIGGTFRPCSNGTLEPCVDECEAIKAKRRHWPDASCPQ